MRALSEQWLREMGFRWEQGERQPTKHWLLWIAQACIDPVEPGRKMFASNDDLGIEVAPDTNGKFWYCWLRADYAGRYSRLVHIRHISQQDEVVSIIEATTGRPFVPGDVLYGSFRDPETAQRMRDENERLDRRIAKSVMDSVDRQCGNDPTRIGTV